MKATFKNIGPISDAELELGDLTIIAGQNNTGKTYLVYTLYGFLKFLKDEFNIPLIDIEEWRNDEGIRKIANQIEATGTASVEFETHKELNNRMMQGASSIFSSHLIGKVFSSPNGEFDNALFDLEAKSELSHGVKIYASESKEHRTFLTVSVIENKVVFELNNSENISFSNEQIVSGLYRLLRKAIRNNCPQPFILSAERFGISLFYKELDFTKNKLIEALQNASDDKDFDFSEFLEKGSARYAQPIKDNIHFTRDLSSIQKVRKELITDKFHSVEKIIDGYYKEANNEIRFISKKRGDNHFDIPLHLASSSARGVSDLYFYLKHVAEPGKILIVDEPESHLSPTNQIMMARLLVFCVNAGLKILITTHSDYLIKEINNLIMLNSDFEGKDAFLKKHKKDYTEADRLNPERVKAYTCANGTLQKCDVDEKGIDMPVFDNAIDKINQISNELGWRISPDDG